MRKYVLIEVLEEVNMASRIIHLAICKQLEGALGVKDANRLRIGHVLPDAIIRGDKAHAASHYKLTVCEGNKKMMDFTGFYRQFSTKLLEDSLYLGYYFHLIEDAIYRKFLYYDYKLSGNRGQEFLEALYNDYAILNVYLIKAYKLTNTLKIPEHFVEEEINKIYPFILQEFLLDMSNDFTFSIAKKTKYFTEDMVEEFIGRCVSICKIEFEKIQIDKSCLNPFEFAWDR
jgi:predicted nuclease of restriction endonuclease-like (RecB) superfamily